MHCMIVLGLDTTTRTGSLAVMRDGLLLETAALPPGQPAASLPAEVGALIARHAIRIDQVSAFAVAVGPGSFTGLRIGVATMQGFAVAGRRPLIGVSGLDALALEAGSGVVATWVDAWRGEVYAVWYRDGVAAGEPTVDEPGSVLAGMEPAHGAHPVRFAGDGAERYRARIEEAHAQWRVVETAAPLLAGQVARIACRRLEGGETGAPGAVQPLYVRRPDVELVRSARRGQEQPRV